MGRMDMGLNGLDVKKLDANSSRLNPGLDARTTNGTAQSEVILSGNFGLKSTVWVSETSTCKLGL